MSLLLFLLVDVRFGGARRARRPRRERVADGRRARRARRARSLAALAIDPAQVVEIGGGGFATTAYLRLFLVLGSLVGLRLASSGLAGGSRPRRARGHPRHPRRACRADPGPRRRRAPPSWPRPPAGCSGSLVTLIPGGGRAGATVGIRETRAVVVAGALAIAATAWFGRDLSRARRPAGRLRARLPRLRPGGRDPLRGHPVPRLGGTPDRCRPRDRPADRSPPRRRPRSRSSPWPGPTRRSRRSWSTSTRRARSCSAIAIASIVLAAIAACVQDDLEHILGYSIIGDAGVVMLALAALDPEAWAPARTWILAFVVARSAFAAWAAGDPRTAFWTGRVADLRGWALALAAPRDRLRDGRRRQRSGSPGSPPSTRASALVDLALDGTARRHRPGRDAWRRSPTTDGCSSSGCPGRTGSSNRVGDVAAARHAAGRDRPSARWLADDLGANRAFTTAAIAVAARRSSPSRRRSGRSAGRRRGRAAAGLGEPVDVPPSRYAGAAAGRSVVP